MASLHDLGLTEDDWVSYLRGTASVDVSKKIEEHWFDEDFPHPVVSEEKIQEVAKENGSEFRQEISVTGRNIDDVFRLDCVRSVVKGLDGQPLFILKDGQSAHIGDTLRENQAGRWTVKRGGA